MVVSTKNRLNKWKRGQIKYAESKELMVPVIRRCIDNLTVIVGCMQVTCTVTGNDLDGMIGTLNAPKKLRRAN